MSWDRYSKINGIRISCLLMTDVFAQQLHDLLAEKKFSDIAILDLRGLTSIADYFIIATGTSNRQLLAGAQYLQERLKPGQQVHIEGDQLCDWVLVDAGDVIVHLFRSQTRDLYQLEDRWRRDPASVVEILQGKNGVNDNEMLG